MQLFLLAKILLFRRFISCRLALAGLLGTVPLAGRAQAPVFGPAVVVGSAVGTGSSVVTGTAVDAQGYVYATGNYSGTVQFGATTVTTAYPTSALGNGFVAKLDGAGVVQWVRTMAGPAHGSTRGLAVDASGTVTVTGVFFGDTATVGPFILTNATTYANNTSDGFVARLDTNGNWLWAAQAGGSLSDGLGRPVLDAAGNVYVSGGFASPTIALGGTTLANAGTAGTYDVFIAKLSAQGTWQWARRGGGVNEDNIAGMVLDASGNLYYTGLVEGTATFGSLTTTNPVANADVLVAKLDAQGNWLWLARGGSIGFDQGTGIVLDAANNIYIAGNFDGPTATFGASALTNANPNSTSSNSRDVLVAKLDAAGTWQWAVRAGGPLGDSGGPIALGAAGQLVVAGTFYSATAQFGAFSLPNTASGPAPSGGYWPSTLFLAALSPAGTWLGVSTSQGGAGPVPSCLAPDAYGNISLGGSFESATIGLGSNALAGQVSNATGFVTLVPMVPTIDTFAPGSGAPGTVVSVTGTGFSGVTQVLFNGISAASFAVQSTTHLLATVPAGVTAGPVSVRTSSSTGISGTPFQPVVLATAPALAAEAGVWPNPAAVGEPWQLHLPAAFGLAPGRAEVRNLLGQLVFQAQLSGQVASLRVPRLAPGVYQLALWPAAQPAQQHRVVVAD